MTFVRDSVICDGCGKAHSWQEFNDALISKTTAPWVKATVDVRGCGMVFTFCPTCAQRPMLLPPATEIARRVEEILR